jgi:ubiquinone/menaquinone biosynthesis C-methylase UbiE
LEEEARNRPTPKELGARRNALRNALYARQAESETHRAIFREVYGAEYPEEVLPLGFITRTLLRRIAKAIAAGPGQTIIDLGCGRGGPGLWVARETGASIVGIDISPVAVEHASQRARKFGVQGRARFETGDLVALRFSTAEFDAAMSVDVLFLLSPNTLSALSSFARVLKPGARFAFTNWERDLSPPGYPPPVSDLRPFLREAGFEVETYEEVPDAEARRRAIYQLYIQRKEALARELGEEAVQILMFEARTSLGLEDGTDYLAHSRRIYAVTRRR